MSVDKYYQAFKKLGVPTKAAYRYARVVMTSKNRETAFDTILAIVGPRKNPGKARSLTRYPKRHPYDRTERSVGEAASEAYDFLLRHPRAWHGFVNKGVTRKAVEKLVRLGHAETNGFNQFRLKK